MGSAPLVGEEFSLQCLEQLEEAKQEGGTLLPQAWSSPSSRRPAEVWGEAVRSCDGGA